MGVNVIFRIAAVGNFLKRLRALSGVKTQRAGGTGIFNQSGGTDPGVVVDDPVHI